MSGRREWAGGEAWYQASSKAIYAMYRNFRAGCSAALVTEWLDRVEDEPSSEIVRVCDAFVLDRTRQYAPKLAEWLAKFPSKRSQVQDELFVNPAKSLCWDVDGWWQGSFGALSNAKRNDIAEYVIKFWRGKIYQAPVLQLLSHLTGLVDLDLESEIDRVWYEHRKAVDGVSAALFS